MVSAFVVVAKREILACSLQKIQSTKNDNEHYARVTPHTGEAARANKSLIGGARQGHAREQENR
jgi:hypothetical protein